MMDAERLGCAKNPLYGLLELAPADTAAFIAGDVDDARIEELLFGVSLVDWRLDPEAKIRRELQQKWSRPVRDTAIPSQFALLKLVYWPNRLPIDGGVEVAVVPEPSTVPLLLARRVDEACRIARRRLFTSGLAPVDVEWPRLTGLDPIRLAAALLLPCRALSTLTRSVLTAPAAR
jgi:CRISPR-associated protein Csx17